MTAIALGTGATLSVLEILAAISLSAYLTQTISSALNPSEIRWEGKLLGELKFSSPTLPSPFPLPELDGFILELEASNGYEGSWAVGTLGQSLDLLPSADSTTFDYNAEQDVVMYTPRYVGTSPWSFFGFATQGKVEVPGFSGTGLIVGWGKGYIVDVPLQGGHSLALESMLVFQHLYLIALDNSSFLMYRFS